MGLQKLNDRIRDATLQTAFEGLFPRDDPSNSRFSINFFTNIGLGALTEDLRAHLKANPKPVARVAPMIKGDGEGGSDSDSSSRCEQQLAVTTYFSNAFFCRKWSLPGNSKIVAISIDR